jgi:hypothetical protein
MSTAETLTFDKQGYVRIKGFFDMKQVEALAASVDRIHAQWLAEHHAEYADRLLVNMHSLTSPQYFTHDPAARINFFECIAPPKLTRLLDDMFGDGLYFHNTQLFFNPFENRRLPYWHRDMQYSPVDDAAQASEQRNMTSLHVRIPLVRETGVELVPGTHRRWDTPLESDVRFERNGHRNSDDLPGAELIDLDAGDILIFDAQMIHRGNYRMNKTRKAFDLCVGKPHRFTSGYLDDSVLPGEHEIDRIANNAWYRRARQVAAANAMQQAPEARRG